MANLTLQNFEEIARLPLAELQGWLERLDTSQLEALSAALSMKGPCQHDGQWWKFRPYPKQEAFISLNDREVLYGGAGGGGKSWALLMDASRYACVPGYSAILFRQTYPQLARAGGFVDLSHQWWSGTKARYAKSDRRWTFPSGATITLGFLERAEDRFKWAGPTFQYTGWDEITNWATDKPYRFVGFTRVRRPAPSPTLPRCPFCNLSVADVPLRTRAGTNPGGPGAGWVTRRWITPWVAWRDGRGPAPWRRYLPALMTDNPGLDADSYRAGLAELDPVTRAQIERGDWSVSETNGLYLRSWVHDSLDWPRGAMTIRYWDLAGTNPAESKRKGDPDWTVGARVTLDGGRWTWSSIVRFRKNPAETEAIVRSVADADGPQVGIFMETEPGQSGKKVILDYSRLLADRMFRGWPSANKMARFRHVSAAVANGNVTLVEPRIGAFEAEADTIHAELESFDGLGRTHDDIVDAVSGAHDVLSRFPQLVGGPVVVEAEGATSGRVEVPASAGVGWGAIT